MGPFRALPTLLLSLAVPVSGWAAEANFYTLHDPWAKKAETRKSGREQAIEENFSNAFAGRRARAEDMTVPGPPAVYRSFAETAAAQGPLEIEFGQTLVLQKVGGLLKFIATDEGIVTLESVDNENLRMIGTGIGATFVHVWSSAGRTTLPVKVLLPKIRASASQVRERQALDKERPFRISYDNARGASYTGDKFRESARSSVDFSQNFRIVGDTPHGELSAHALTQKARGKHLLTDAQAHLKDGKIGAFRNFNATAGDARVEPALMVFPQARIRGAALEHWDDKKRVEWNGFYGRENSSLIGTLTPGIESKRTLNSYLTGGTVDAKLNDNAQVKAGYFRGWGRSRRDELNDHGFGAQTELKLGPHAVANLETDFDNEKAAQKHSFTARFEKLRVKNEFRDISKKFFTLVGSPTRQGEIGYLLDVSGAPSPKWAYSGTLDIFRDRLVPNPADPDSVNIHTDLALNYFPCHDLNFALTFQDFDDTGRLGPSRYRNVGLQYNEQFDAWGHRATLFARYNHRTNHILTNSLSDYRQDQVSTGIYTSIFWGINLSVQKEWNYLEEVEVGRLTHPAAMTYSLDTTRQLGDTPFFVEARYRYRDEEETESPTSFMAGEDSAEFSGGLYYREYEDMEIFLTGSLTQYMPESLNVTTARTEAQFLTGMRCSFDTGFRWTTTSAFEGSVFKDVNGDGVRQEGEPGFPDMIVRSSDGKEAVTDGEGRYQIQAVQGREASLELDSSRIPHGFVPTSGPAPAAAAGQEKIRRVDFGLTPRSDVTGIVFNDVDGDGKFSTQEPGVGKVRLALGNGQTARTNGKGVYTFSNLPAGRHEMTLQLTTLPEGYLPQQSQKKEFTLTEGIRYEIHYPLRAKRTVSGQVYWDQDRNGSLGDRDIPLAGVLVKLGDLSMPTDKDGWYLFDDLKPGVYPLRVEAHAQTLELPVEPKTLAGVNIALERES